MERIVAYSICLVLIIIGIKGSIQNSIYDRSIRSSLNRVCYYLAVLLAFIIISINLDKVIMIIIKVSAQYFEVNADQNQLVRIVALIFVYFIIQIIIYSVLKLLIMPIERGSRALNYKSKTFVFLSGILGVVKGLIGILILFLGVTTFNYTIGNNFNIALFDNIPGYSEVKSLVEEKKPQRIVYSDESEIPTTSNVLIYYNGVTLDEGIKSNSDIDKKALSLVNAEDSDREKARKLYVWIGSNITYDFQKAENALSNNDVQNSGAIEAWNTRSGICFDYSCLYVAMARANGLKVRLITGKGFDGKQFGPHAWNEVYLKDEDKWIPVDTTFYQSGDYFDTSNFDDDHIKESIAGEW